jgi:diamine N-acetyltransferase
MDMYLSRAYTEAAQRAELEDPAMHTVLVECDGEAIAFAQLRDGGAPACVTGPAPVELKRIYVDARWHGRGVAQTLFAEVMRVAKERGGQTMHLGVWEHNVRALAFYAKHGFIDVGERTFLLGTTTDRDRVLMRSL